MVGSSPDQHITNSGVRVVKSYFDDIRLHVEVQSQRDAEKLFNYLYERRHGNE
jgi:predicted solute-binding protein